MPLILLTFLAAFLIESIGTYVSVVGLSALFGSNPVIISLVIALDIGKLVVVTLLYKHWKDLGKVMRSYAFLAAMITMIITSSGAAGYLSSEFQKAIVGTQESAQKIEILKTQEAKYEDRKKQIDAQIAALPEKTTVTNRLRLMNGFKTEQKDLQDKINALDAQLPALQTAQIGVEAHAGPILVIAKMFNVPVEKAVQWVIMTIIPVFDPLAIFLLIAGNFLTELREKKRVAPERGPVQLEKIDLVTDDMMDEANAPVGSPEWNRAMDNIKKIIPDDATWSVGKDRTSKVEVLPGGADDPIQQQANINEFNARLATALGIRQEHEDSESRYERALAAADRIEHEMEQEDFQKRLERGLKIPALTPATLTNPGLPVLEVPEVHHEPTPKTYDDTHVERHPRGADEPTVVESVPEPVEVPEASPVSPEVLPELASILLEGVPAVKMNEREVITRQHLIPQATSSLNFVKADETVTFHEGNSTLTPLYKSMG